MAKQALKQAPSKTKLAKRTKRAAQQAASPSPETVKPNGAVHQYRKDGRLHPDFYLTELLRLQEELVKLQYWVKEQGLKIAIVFEGRDAAGKGGVIKRIVERTNPRIIRVVALGVPTEREKSQWYFQRWAAQLPAAGEIALFDRSWYTRAVTEHVMGFCTDDEYADFLRSCPEFERMLVRSGLIVLKYWFSVSDDVQEQRFQKRAADPRRRWKLSPMDIESRNKWVEYSRHKDRMMEATDIKECKWYVVDADDKEKARLNCISHILSVIPYEDVLPGPIELPPRVEEGGYQRPPMEKQSFVPSTY